MSEFKPGERVRVTIEGPVTQGALNSLLYIDAGADVQAEIPMDAPRVTVERVAPAEWPPRPGDVWRSDVEPFFAATDTRGCVDIDGGQVFLVNVAGTFMHPETVLSHGPLTLVHREDEQDGGAR